VGADFKGLEVLPALGRNDLGQLRAVQTPRRRASRAGAQVARERGRRRGQFSCVGLATFDRD
jgi:hypothetical protein